MSAVNQRYLFSVPLTDAQLATLKARWAECLGTPPPPGCGIFMAVSFKTGSARVMITRTAETEVIRKMLNQVAVQSEMVEVEV